jgi:hypothetical protein
MAKKLFMAEITDTVTQPYLFYVADKNIGRNIEEIISDNAKSIKEEMCDKLLPLSARNIRPVTEKQALKSGISQETLNWLKNDAIFGIDLHYPKDEKLAELLRKDYERMKTKSIVG